MRRCLLKGSLELKIALLLSGSQQAVGQGDQVQPLRDKEGWSPRANSLKKGTCRVAETKD